MTSTDLQERFNVMQVQIFLLMQEKKNLQHKVKVLQDENLVLKKCLKVKINENIQSWIDPFEKSVNDILQQYGEEAFHFEAEDDDPKAQRFGKARKANKGNVPAVSPEPPVKIACVKAAPPSYPPFDDDGPAVSNTSPKLPNISQLSDEDLRERKMSVSSDDDNVRPNARMDIDANISHQKRKRVQSVIASKPPKALTDSLLKEFDETGETSKGGYGPIFEKSQGQIYKEYSLSDSKSYNNTKVSLIVSNNWALEPVQCLVCSQSKDMKLSASSSAQELVKVYADFEKVCAAQMAERKGQALKPGEVLTCEIKSSNKKIRATHAISVYAGDMGNNIFKIQEHIKTAIYNVMEVADGLKSPSICFAPFSSSSETFNVDKKFWLMSLHETFTAITGYYTQNKYSCNMMDIRIMVGTEKDALDAVKILDSDYKKYTDFLSKDISSTLEKINAAKTLTNTIVAQEPEPKEELPPPELEPSKYYVVDITTMDCNTPPVDAPDTIEWMDDESNQIKCATLSKLIERVTYHSNYDNAFLYAFLLTYRSFTTPHELMDQLLARYNTAPPKKDISKQEFAKWYSEMLKQIRLRVTQVIKYWLENHFYDYNDEDLVKKLQDLIALMEKTEGGAYAKQLARALDKKLQDKKLGTQVNVSSTIPAPVLIRGFQKGKTYPILDWPSKEIARQLCLLEYSRFREIKPSECLNQSWNKDHRELKAPNIYKMIQWFNVVSRWSATCIVQETNIKNRAKNLLKIIEIAQECRLLNNFNAVFELVSGLNNSSVYRLRKTWDQLKPAQKKQFDELQALSAQDCNFRSLRNAIINLKPPCIPYIGVFLTDLTFIEDGNPNTLNDKINFIKRRKLAMLIRDIQTYQQTPYELQDVPELQQMFSELKPLSEEEMYKESLKIEPREKK